MDKEPLMTTEDLIMLIFIEVDNAMPAMPKHPQAKLYPSELVTIGILYALKGGKFKAFYTRFAGHFRWLKRDYRGLFALPHRTRLLRLLKAHQDWSDYLLAEVSFFTVIDSYPIELLFPIREGRSDKQIGKKSKDKGRWIIGIKLCWLINDRGEVVAWNWAEANAHDQDFHPLIECFDGETIVLGDFGFRSAEGIPDNLKLCAKGTWNERMVIETAFSMVTTVSDLKRMSHRKAGYVDAKLAFVAAMFNVLLRLHRQLHPEADPFDMSIAEFSL